MDDTAPATRADGESVGGVDIAGEYDYLPRRCGGLPGEERFEDGVATVDEGRGAPAIAHLVATLARSPIEQDRHPAGDMHDRYGADGKQRLDRGGVWPLQVRLHVSPLPLAEQLPVLV